MSDVSPEALAVLRQLNDGEFRSGERLAGALGVSRAALWKRIEALRALGVAVEAVPRRGYRLPFPVEPLEVARIGAVLRERGLAPKVEVVFSVPSTNTALVSRLQTEPVALLAECQTGGRGRWGRQWTSSYGGGIYLSLAWRFGHLPVSPAGLSLAVGANVAAALDPSGGSIGLKWPNDLVARQGKLGGMLIELVGEPSGPCHVVVGVGLNYRMSGAVRAALDQPAAELTSVLTEPVPGRNEVAAVMIAAIMEACRRFGEAGLAPFLPAWTARDVLAGEAVRVMLPDRTIEGEAAGVDETGALQVKTRDGTLSCFSGDVQLKVRR